MLVVVSYGSLTFYDLLALRTIGRTDIPYRIAALASFTSYPIAHGIGAVSLISPVIRYRIYSFNGLGAFDVANICFLTGLTFWLGNLTALGIGLFFEPGRSAWSISCRRRSINGSRRRCCWGSRLSWSGAGFRAKHRDQAVAGPASIGTVGAAADRDRGFRSRRCGACDVCADSGRDRISGYSRSSLFSLPRRYWDLPATRRRESASSTQRS